jgi:tetratricopeptide (TPR) repeat protein
VVQRKRPSTAPRGPDLRARVERALRESRLPRALELAKTLFHQQATPEHRALLRQAYLARARELRDRGATHDSLHVLKEALASQGDDPAWLLQIAEQFALSGGIADALALLPSITDAAMQERLRGHIVDSALQTGTAGRALLPEMFQADFDRVTRAFEQSEAGQDEAARATLAEIGLRSPFLEWKLLGRGLLAYYAKDDVRALENWQRLNPERLPYRLAAPLRQMFDAAFRAAQPPPTQTLLREQLDRLQGSELITQLRGLRSAVANKENLAPAFRQAEVLLPELRRAAPALVERLGHILYWSIIEGSPDDVPRYQRVFGRPPTDPQFNRLQAIAYERIGDFERAHKNWQKYEKEIADKPAHWPEARAERARALIWAHIGDNAALIPSAAKMKQLPAFLGEFPGASRPLKPSAEQCYLKAIELAPDLLEPHEALFKLYREAGNDKKAEAAGQRLLKRFPDHVATLEQLADLLSVGQDKQIEALDLYKRALQTNPLERRLRAKTVATHLGCARLFAMDKDFDHARQELQAALALSGGTPDFSYLCRSASIEIKAGGDPAQVEEILAQARQKMSSAAGVSYLMLIETIRLKLPKAFKTRFESEFNAALTGEPSGADAAQMALLTDALSVALPYIGQKTHQKKVLAYLDRIKKANFTDDEYKSITGSLLDLRSIRLARQYLQRAQKDFPRNPHFPYLEAVSYFADKNPERMQVWKVEDLLKKAERIIGELPPTEELKALSNEIDERKQTLAAINPFAMGMLDNLFSMPFDGEEDFADDYED